MAWIEHDREFYNLDAVRRIRRSNDKFYLDPKNKDTGAMTLYTRDSDEADALYSKLKTLLTNSHTFNFVE